MINVEKIKPNGLFTNYIYKAIPLAFDESMSYYETLCGLLSYLQNTVIPALNNNADAIIEIQQLMTQLQEYVDNYFDNLDVQDEIDHKLDEMVEDGTLQEIIGSYLNSKAVFGFDTVQAMKEGTNLIDGSYAETLGFYEKNDLGGALYKIRTITESDTINEKTLIALSETLLAELIINDTMNVEQFGAYGDNDNDDTDAIQLAINSCKTIKLNKTYVTSGQITINKACNIIGVGATINSTLTGKISVFKVLHSNVKFDGLSINLTYNGGGTTGEHGNTISIATYKMDSSMDLENIEITNCNLVRTGTNSYNIGIFGDSHNIVVKNNYIYGECVNMHWSGDFDERYPDTALCSITFHPYNITIENNVLENNRGVFISAGYNIKVLNNQFIDNTYGLTLSIGDYGNTMAGAEQKPFIMTGIDIENCSFIGYTNQAVYCQGYGYRQDDTLHQKNYLPTSKVNIRNCNFGDTESNVNTAIISPILFSGLTIENCNFISSHRTVGIYASPIFDSTIKNCYFDIVGTPITLFGSRNVIIDGCKSTIKTTYNFVRTNQYAFDFTGLTYINENLTIQNNDVDCATGSTLILLLYTKHVVIQNNNLLKCNIGVNTNTSNDDVYVINNKFSDSSSTFVGVHGNISTNNCKTLIAKNNKFNGANGLKITTNTTNCLVSDNIMIENGFTGTLCSVDSRSNKNVFLVGNITDSTANLTYGSDYSYINYTENE